MIIFLLFFLFIQNANAQEYYHVYKAKRIIDGDTFEVDTSRESILVDKLKLEVRIYGIDAPEKKGKCKKEKDLAQIATNFTKELVLNKEVVLINPKWDKYGGRIVATVLQDNINIGQELLKRNLAVPYKGGKKINMWCN